MRLRMRFINKACDMLPTFDSHSSAEVVKGSSAPAYKHSRCTQNYDDVFHIHHLYVCVSLSVCVCVWLPCCLDNLLPFLFLFALGAESGLTPTQEQESEQRGRTENDTVLGFSAHLSSERHPQLAHLLSPVRLQM